MDSKKDLISTMSQPSDSDIQDQLLYINGYRQPFYMTGNYFTIDDKPVYVMSSIDLAALNGSVECFRYLLSLNNAGTTSHTFNMAVIGGNLEIVQLLNQNGTDVDYICALKLAMRYCRYDIANWIYNSIDMSNPTISADDYSYCLMVDSVLKST